MFLFVFVGFKRRSGEISKFQVLIPANLGSGYIQPPKVPECAGDSGVFPYLSCCALPSL